MGFFFSWLFFHLEISTLYLYPILKCRTREESHTVVFSFLHQDLVWLQRTEVREPWLSNPDRGLIPLCCLPALLHTGGLSQGCVGLSALKKPSEEACCQPPLGSMCSLCFAGARRWLAGHLRLWEGPLSILVDSQLLLQEAVSQGLPLNNRSFLLVLRCHLCDLS